MLLLLLLLLLKVQLLLVELVNGRGEYLCIVVWPIKARVLVLFNPEVLRRLEVIPENGDNLLDLVIGIGVYEEIEGVNFTYDSLFL